MLQKITLSIMFNNTSFSLNILNIYKINEQLIAISEISSADCGSAAMTTCTDSITVYTKIPNTLPVIHYALVSDNLKSHSSFTSESGQRVTVIESLSAVPEFDGKLDIEPLHRITQASTWAKFLPWSKAGESEDDKEEQGLSCSL